MSNTNPNCCPNLIFLTVISYNILGPCPYFFFKVEKQMRQPFAMLLLEDDQSQAPTFWTIKNTSYTMKNIHKDTNIMANIRFSPFLSPWLAALTCRLVVHLSVPMIEITVCYHSVSMGQKNISLFWKQAHTRWCCLSVDKQLAFWGQKLQFVPHRKQATPVCAAEWSRDSAPHNRK